MLQNLRPQLVLFCFGRAPGNRVPIRISLLIRLIHWSKPLQNPPGSVYGLYLHLPRLRAVSRRDELPRSLSRRHGTRAAAMKDAGLPPSRVETIRHPNPPSPRKRCTHPVIPTSSTRRKPARDFPFTSRRNPNRLVGKSPLHSVRATVLSPIFEAKHLLICSNSYKA